LQSKIPEKKFLPAGVVAQNIPEKKGKGKLQLHF